jgi:beta-phosphoglucomutase-like phosphatase (HAD superfamily)
MKKALIFDCDGVLADTELYGHLPAFNRMWREFGVPWQWSETEYRKMLAIGGGRERLAALFQDEMFLKQVQPAKSHAERARLVCSWHERKTAIYKEIVASGSIPARTGVRRLVEQAFDGGWTLAVASTSVLGSVQAVLNIAVGADLAAHFVLVLAGDVVPNKKPAPDIYILATERLGVHSDRAIAIEDSNNGLCAARAAGMRCVITPSSMTLQEDFSAADLVVTSLGAEHDVEFRVLANRSTANPDSFLSVSDLNALLTGPVH